MLPPGLFDDEHVTEPTKVEGACVFQDQAVASTTTTVSTVCEEMAEITADSNRPGMPLKWDPYGRDGPRRSEVKTEWSADPLAKYLRGVVSQIDANLTNHCVPSNDKLDAFVSRLVANTHRQMKHAPKRAKHTLQGMFSRRFLRFWNFVRNEKVRTTTPEELKGALVSLIEGLTTEFEVNPDVLTEQPRPGRSGACFRRLSD